VNRSHVVVAALFGGALVACSPLTFSHSTRMFADEVLQPIAAQQVEERIVQARALLAQINVAKEQLAAGQPLTPETQTTLNGIVGLVALTVADPRGAELLRSFVDPKVKKPLAARKTAYQDVLAWLDSRRAPLQQELVRRLVGRTVQTDKRFLVCVDGAQRQYEAAEAGRYVRQADKPGTC